MDTVSGRDHVEDLMESIYERVSRCLILSKVQIVGNVRCLSIDKTSSRSRVSGIFLRYLVTRNQAENDMGMNEYDLMDLRRKMNFVLVVQWRSE
jgi:hypothetical protein